MPSPLRKFSFVCAILFAISCIAPFTTALPGGTRPREVQLPGFLSFIPDCARECTAGKIAEQNCQGGSQECLCRGGPQKFQNLIWSCIDGGCGPASQGHKDSEASVMGLCNESATPTTSTSSVSSSQAAPVTDSSGSATATLTTSRSFQIVPTSQTSSSSAAVIGNLPIHTVDADSNASGGATASASADAVKEERTVLSTPAIIGISVGSFCLLAAVVGACVFCACRKNRRKQARPLEPHSPRGRAVIGGGKENIGYGGWISIDNTNTGDYYSNHRTPPINADVANEKLNAHLDPNISPVSPISPIIPQGFEFGDSVQQRSKVVGSQMAIENPHLSMPPVVIYTPASPIGSADRTSDSVILPSPAQNRASSSHFSVHSYNGYPGIAISTDSPGAFPISSNRHTCSPIAMEGSNHLSDSLISSASPPGYTPSPVPESSANIRSSVHSPHGQPAVGISRSDTLAWRRELDEAAGRALTRVLRSEQSNNEEMDEAKRRKSSIPGLDRLSKRLSRDHRADEENSLVGGERSPGFWGSFGSKGDRRNPRRNSGLLSIRSNSGASGGSRRSIIPGRGGIV